PAGSFAAHSDLIDDCFAKDTAEEIVAALDTADNEWASEQATTIRTKSPETVKVALRQVRDGA
ncbi:MAG TPA: enoyl-CoA hydratase, partial [Hyphomonas sp.]|nr:enoyl-CoA hydratase [Hyphomonas sp.]